MNVTNNLFLVPAEFKGSIHAVIRPTTTLGKIKELHERYPNAEAVDDQRLDELLAEFNNSMITEPKEITWDQFEMMFEMMPPEKWSSRNGWESFHSPERVYGNLVSWYAQKGNKSYTFIHHETLTREQFVKVMAKVEVAA